jgi:3',5'-cyclic AMP phosphodiesterase CpdA
VIKTIKVALLAVTVAVLAIFLWGVVWPKVAVAPTGEFSRSTTSVPLKFAVLSDIHSDLPNLTKALNQAKNDQVSLVIVTGDLTDVGTVAELAAVKKTLTASGLPYYVVPGNHDYWQSRNLDQNVFKQVFGASYSPQTIYYGHGILSKEVMLVLVDNGDDYSGLGSEQWAWLRQELTSCHQIRCLVFMHEPLNHPSSEHVMGEGHPAVATEAATLRQTLVAAGVKDLFTGHLHSSHRYVLDGLTTRIVGAVATARNWQTPRFLEVTVGDPLVEREVVIE